MKHFFLLLAFFLPSLSFGLTLTQTADVVEITPVTTGNYFWRFHSDPDSNPDFSIQMNGTGVQQALFDDIAWSKLIIGDTYWFMEFSVSSPACSTFNNCLSDPDLVASYPSFLMTAGATIEPTPAGTTLFVSTVSGVWISSFFDFAVALFTNVIFISVLIALVVLYFGVNLIRSKMNI